MYNNVALTQSELYSLIALASRWLYNENSASNKANKSYNRLQMTADCESLVNKATRALSAPLSNYGRDTLKLPVNINNQ